MKSSCNLDKDEFDIETVSEKRNPLFSLLLKIMAIIFILILLFTFTNLFSPLLNLFFSETINDNILEFSNHKIEFSKIIRAKLYGEYLAHPDREIKVCFTGTSNVYSDGSGEMIYVYLDSAYIPKYFEADVVHITTESCPRDTLVELHSHPGGNCMASRTDISTFSKIRLSDSDRLFLIMCDIDRFSLY